MLWRALCLLFFGTIIVVMFVAFFSSCRSLHEYEAIPYVEYADYEVDDGNNITEKRIGTTFAPRPEVTGKPFRDARAEAAIERLTAIIEAAGYDPETGMHVDSEGNVWGTLGVGGGAAGTTLLTMLMLLRYGIIGGGSKDSSEPA